VNDIIAGSGVGRETATSIVPEALPTRLKGMVDEIHGTWIEKRLRLKAEVEAKLAETKEELRLLKRREADRVRKAKKRAYKDGPAKPADEEADYAELFSARFQSPRWTFDDVLGLDAQKDLMHEIIGLPQLLPEAYTGPLAAPAHMLLKGPPGNGKTLFAEAVAGQYGITNFLSLTAADLLGGTVGASARRTAGLFRALRENTPALLFIDEADSLLASRHNGTVDNAGNSDQVGVLLAEISRTMTNFDEVHVLVAMNSTTELDRGAHRRFPHKVLFSNPKIEAIRGIWERTWKGLKREILISEGEYDDAIRGLNTICYDGCQTIAVNAVRTSLRSYQKGEKLPPIKIEHLRLGITRYYESEEIIAEPPAARATADIADAGLTGDDLSDINLAGIDVNLYSALFPPATNSRASSLASYRAAETDRPPAAVPIAGCCPFNCGKRDVTGFNLAQHLSSRHLGLLDEVYKEFCLEEFRRAGKAAPMDLLVQPDGPGPGKKKPRKK
jgi:hypothetical protein